ncbi:hypothetical protein FHETE_4395 [Fusarium heterosporum]|uniref:Uncharacterized protein n=1 Tax=Fusarium heterosporum TaxID=42747 RepID=A0A8H5WU80_FUSHE|nr:hypothetical protein FHETE_4395 [Fusarium heterosporum]
MADKESTVPEAVADQQSLYDNMSLREIFDSMKEEPEGKSVNCLGYDGVLRKFDVERNIIDAIGLNPAQIREYYEGLWTPERLLAADGRKISHEVMFNPDAENIPKKPTAEDIARVEAHNEELAKRGVTCCVPNKSTEDSEPNPR